MSEWDKEDTKAPTVHSLTMPEHAVSIDSTADFDLAKTWLEENCEFGWMYFKARITEILPREDQATFMGDKFDIVSHEHTTLYYILFTDEQDKIKFLLAKAT